MRFVDVLVLADRDPARRGDDAIVFMGLIRDLFADVFDLMPRMRDYDFEESVRQIAMEADNKRFPPALLADGQVGRAEAGSSRACVELSMTDAHGRGRELRLVPAFHDGLISKVVVHEAASNFQCRQNKLKRT